MEKVLNEIYNFSSPRWDDLPESAFNSEIVEFFNDKYGLLVSRDDQLTNSMIQNYVKWKLIPAPKGRKYTREQIAMIIVICLFKQVLPLKEIAKGVELQYKLMEYDKAFNIVAEKLERSIKKVFGPVIAKEGNQITFEQYHANAETIGISSVIVSFTFKLLANYIIKHDGFRNII